MKQQLLILLVLGAALLSCDTDDTEQKPLTTPTVSIGGTPSVGAIGTGGTSLTFAFVQSNVSNSGNLETRSGVIHNDTLSLLLAGKSDSEPADSNAGVGNFRIRINRLQPLRMQYYRFFAKNYKGTVYSPVDSFLSAPRLAAVTLNAPSDVTNNSASLSARLTGNGGESVQQWGIVYSLGQSPVITDPASVVVKTAPSNEINTDFATSATDLLPNRTYYVRAFTVNRGGTFYSSQRNFTTLP